MRVVHADGAARHGLGHERAGGGVIGGAEHDVNALEGVRLGERHGDVLAGKADSLARVHGALARQGHEAPHGEVALLEALEHLLAHHAGGAEDGNGLLAHSGSFLPSGRAGRARGTVQRGQSLLHAHTVQK